MPQTEAQIIGRALGNSVLNTDRHNSVFKETAHPEMSIPLKKIMLSRMLTLKV